MPDNRRYGWRVYWLEVLSTAFSHWRRGEVMSALVLAIFGIPIALMMVAGWHVMFKPEASQLLSIGLAFLFFYLLTVVAPYKVWSAQKRALDDIAELLRANIWVQWAFTDENFFELMLMNRSLKTLPSTELSFRNYKKADGSKVTNVLAPMISVDGKGPRVPLDPLVRTYFRFAQLIFREGGPPIIQLTPSGKEPIAIDDNEIGVKFTVSGDDMPASTIDLRLTVNKDGVVSIETWEGERAVNPASWQGA